MLFPTFDFLLFVVPVLLGAWALHAYPRARVAFLVATSLFFYAAGAKTDPPPTPWYYVGLLIASTVLDFACSHGIARLRERADASPAERHRAKLGANALLGVSLVGNLGLLAYFKYTNFLLAAFADIGQALGFSVQVLHLDLLLPIGISFYTFQTLSYTVDVWRGRIAPEPSFARFALFVNFFPQLVAGPIVRAQEFLPQLRVRPSVDVARLDEGLFRIFKGLVKKLVFADWIAAQLTDRVFAAPETYTSAEILIALYAFTLQLYADFAGYSDIAIGVGLLLGFKLPENFARPYQARDVGEFWRRWHMTLSTWLRDYVFFPLGGSRGSSRRTYFNLWLTMFLVGMWHGASWNFVIYSNVHAFAMVFNRWNRLRERSGSWWSSAAPWLAGLIVAGVAVGWLGTVVLRLDASASAWLVGVTLLAFVVVTWLPTTETRANVALHILLTFHFTVLSRVFFRADSLQVSRDMVAGLLAFDGRGLRPGFVTPAVAAALTFGLLWHFTPRAWTDDFGVQAFRRMPGIVQGLAFALLGLGLMQLLSGMPRAFIYFQF